MDAARIQSRINHGEGIAGRVLGLPYTQYRPDGPDNPTGPWNAIGQMRMWPNPDFKYVGRPPALYGKPIVALLCDRTLLGVGDYLVSDTSTYFVIALQSLLANAGVVCNTMLSFSRPTKGTPGAGYYGGVEHETPLLNNWPASVIAGTKGERTDPNLPGDPRNPWVQILMPASTGVDLRFGDFALDNQPVPQKYVLSNIELTDLGYRITASQAIP